MKFFLVSLLFQLSITGYAQNTGGLTAVYEDRRQLVKLKWQHSGNGILSYKLQRSADNGLWFDIASVPVSLPQQKKFITYTDEKPSAGKNFYRLASITAGNSISYGQPIMVIIGKPGNSWIMYPVPVTDVLNLQYNGINIITGVIGITIQNIRTGQVFHKLRMASVNRLIRIPVSNLGRGIYLVSISIGNEVVWNQQFSK
jgi:Secretion system C-terminal sorting domain